MSHVFQSLPGRSLANVRIAATAALFVVGLTSALAQTCMTWVQRGNAVPVNPVGTPGQRVHHAMAYDSDRGVTVFFGGEIGKKGSETYFNDTWEYDGVHWRQIPIAGDLPNPRSYHAMAYDPVRKRVVMSGGFGGGTYGLGDTWEYQRNGVSGSWLLVNGTAQYMGLVAGGMIWDPIQKIMLRF